MANFVLTFSHFHYHGNRGRSNVNFKVGVKLPDIENALFGATSLVLSFVLAEFWQIFCVKIPKFSLPWQPGSV